MPASRSARRGVAALLALVGALALRPAPARAWDGIGHMTIAAIAWDRLSPATRRRVVALLRAAPADAGLTQLRPSTRAPDANDRILFLRAATWADLVRDRAAPEGMRRQDRPRWHYRDVYWRADSGGRPVAVTGLPVGDPGVAERIGELTRTLGDASRAPAERGIALAWLLHLVGDVHQPLHAGSRVTPATPRGDRGGNEVRLGRTNVHALWDDALDRSPARRPGESGGRSLGDEAQRARADGWAARLQRTFPAAGFRAALADTVPTRWADAGLALAQRHAYGPDVVDGGPIPVGYRERLRKVSEPQVALAGYRLAALLERALGR